MGTDHIIIVPTGRLTATGHKPGVALAYLATASQAETQEGADEILAIEEKLVGLNERDLYLAAHDDDPVAPRIGGSKVKASTLKYLAKYEWERRKAEGERHKAHQIHSRWVIGLIVTSVMALISTAVAIYLALEK